MSLVLNGILSFLIFDITIFPLLIHTISSCCVISDIHFTQSEICVLIFPSFGSKMFDQSNRWIISSLVGY